MKTYSNTTQILTEIQFGGIEIVRLCRNFVSFKFFPQNAPFDHTINFFYNKKNISDHIGSYRATSGKKNSPGMCMQPCPALTVHPNESNASAPTKMAHMYFPVLERKENVKL